MTLKNIVTVKSRLGVTHPANLFTVMQSHSMSSKLVPIESPYAIFC